MPLYHRALAIAPASSPRIFIAQFRRPYGLSRLRGSVDIRLQISISHCERPGQWASGRMFFVAVTGYGVKTNGVFATRLSSEHT